MADWWDQLGTNIGNALIGPQTFGNLMPRTRNRQRRRPTAIEPTDRAGLAADHRAGGQ